MPGIAPQQSQALAAALGTLSQTPQSAILAQQNQQLADLLQSTEQQGRQHSSTLGALAANLGADFFNQKNLNANQQQLAAAIQSGLAATKAAVESSIRPSPPQAATTGITPPAPSPTPAAAAPLPQASPVAANATTTAAAAATPPAAPSPSADDVEADVQAAVNAQNSATPATSDQSGNLKGNFQLTPVYGSDVRPAETVTRQPSALAGTGIGMGNDDPVLAALVQKAGGALSGPDPGTTASVNALADQIMGSGGAPSTTGQPPNSGAMASAGAPTGFSGAAGADPRVGPPVTPADKDALIRMVYGEARGEPLQGQQATAAVALNRSILSGQPVSQIVTAPGQFEGMKVGATLDTDSPEYQRVAAAIEPLLSGQMADPSGGATGFYSPGAQAALGRQKPAWDDGSGRQIGSQLFFNHPFAGQQMPQQGDTPYQIASNGPTPPPPSSSLVGGQGAPQGPQQGLQSPQQPLQVQYGPAATPREMATIDAFLSSPSPELRQQGLEMAATIRQRMNTPIEQDDRYDASTGQTTYVPKVPGYGQQQVQGAPQGWRAPLATGQQYSPQGTVQALPGSGIRPMTPQERAAWNIPANDGASYGVGPDGKPVKVADGTFGPATYSANAITQVGPNGKADVQALPGAWTPAQVLEARTNLSGSKPVTDAREAMANYGALQQIATQPGGTKAYAFRDALARIFNPGGIARTNQIELLTNAAGLPDTVKQYFSSLQGDGNLDPRIAQQGLDAAYAFAKSRADQVAGMNASNAALARRHGLDPADLSVDLDPLGAPTSLPGQRSAYAPAQSGPADAAASIAAARAAIARGANRQAVMQRLQAAGLNPGAL